MRKLLNVCACVAMPLFSGCASTTAPGTIGINRAQFLLIPSATVEQATLISYAKAMTAAKESGKLIVSGPDYERLLGIAKRIREQVPIFRADTGKWKWALILIDSPMVNASCGPGGKITFYTGLLNKLKLNDDEIAAVMGHEIAHALREHGRERVSNAMAANIFAQAATARTANPTANAALTNEIAKYIYLLPNSRESESEADKIGLELAARAGYDPHGAVSVWQKMASNEEKKKPEFLSTHPTSEHRLNDLTMLIPKVMALYEMAKQR